MSAIKSTAVGLVTLLSCFAGTNGATAGGLNDTVPLDPAAKSVVLFSGFDVANDAQYVYSGAIVALNRDIGRDGFVLRVYGGHADYQYLNDTVDTDGDGWQGDVMIGYKRSWGRIWAAAFIGIDYQNQQLTPDDISNPARGTEIGFKVAADMATLRTEGPLYFSLSGNYSTAFESYWARARVGANMHRVTIGPEFVALGNVGFDATRVGGFLTFDLPVTPNLPLEVTLSGGYQFVGGSDDSSGGAGTGGGAGGGEGAYFGLSVSSVF